MRPSGGSHIESLFVLHHTPNSHCPAATPVPGAKDLPAAEQEGLYGDGETLVQNARLLREFRKIPENLGRVKRSVA